MKQNKKFWMTVQSLFQLEKTDTRPPGVGNLVHYLGKVSHYLLNLPNRFLYLGHPYRSLLGTDLLHFHTKGYKPHCYF